MTPIANKMSDKLPENSNKKYNEDIENDEANKPKPIQNDLSEQDLMEVRPKNIHIFRDIIFFKLKIIQLEKENELLFENLAMQNEEIRFVDLINFFINLNLNFVLIKLNISITFYELDKIVFNLI